MKSSSILRIGRRLIGPEQPCYVIAEAGVNHNGDLRISEGLIDAAVRAGAHAIKFQTFSAERLATRSAAKARYQKAGASDESQFDMLKRLELSDDDHRHLMRFARERKIEFLSTPFDPASAELLANLGVRAFKIGSGDLTDRFLLSDVARRGRPVLLSTGGASLDDIRSALAVMRSSGNPAVALLHCVSNYPAAAERTNLRAIGELRRVFRLPIGFSDHTPDLLAPIAAVALGASILEKHLTLDRTMAGPDHAFSLDPADFARMVSDIRRTERALGTGRKEPQQGERSIMKVVRKSLFAARRIERDRPIVEQDLVALRPAGGISPMDAGKLIGGVTRKVIEEGTMLKLDAVKGRRHSR